MNNLTDIIRQLRNANARISVDGDRLIVDCKQDLIDDRLKSLISVHKKGLIQYLNEIRTAAHTPIPVIPAGALYPVSSAQRRIWLLSQDSKASIAYNMVGVYTFSGMVNRLVLENSFRILMERHEILRTIFRESEPGEVRQLFDPAGKPEFKLLYRDMRGEERQDELVGEIVRAAVENPFDLSEGPLMRALLLQTADNKWIFVHVMHHIVGDGWSMDILIKELLWSYNTLIKGQKVVFPPLRIQYKDYATWQQRQLSEEGLAVHRDYWLGQLSGELPVLELPLDKTRPARRTFIGGTHKGSIDRVRLKSLKSICKDKGATLFMALLATTNALLYRYTGREDIILGTPVAGRDHPDLEGQIGFYVNTLAMRSRFSGRDSFEDLLHQARQVALEAYQHQRYPFDELVGDLGIRRDTGRNPLFDIMIVLQNATAFVSQEDGMPSELKIAEWTGAHHGTSKFDLTFSFAEADDELKIVLEYNGDIFLPGTAQRLVRHLEQLLTAMIAYPSMPVRGLDYLSREDKHWLLSVVNDTAVPALNNSTIADLFEAQVEKTPEKTALVFEDTLLTYRELNEKANQLADYLRRNFTICPDDLVALVLDRNEWLIISILGVLKAGAAYLPIETDAPPDRIAYILSNSKCKLVIDKAELEKAANQKQLCSSNNPGLTLSPRSLAYVMYTSGSTGRPKGVMIEHAGVIRLAKSPSYVPLESTDILLSTGAINFDAVTFEYWSMLLNGGQLVLCRQDVLSDAVRLWEEMRRRKVSIMWFTAGWFDQLVDTCPEMFKGLKTVLAGGDKLSPVHIRTLQQLYPGLHIVNGYGPTENTTFSLTCLITTFMNNIPIGKPITNTTVYILDDQEALVPVGVFGEICLGGSGLSRGYLNEPGLTAEKFVSNPYCIGERMYKTGDIGRWLPDGNVEFGGRKDDQVKIRGFRIEPGEIENVLQEHELIDRAAVTIMTTGQGEKKLAAYLTGNTMLDAQSLRAYMVGIIPEYMIPDHFVLLEELPLNSNGKVDKGRLSQTAGIILPSSVEYVPPRNHIETELASVWQDILEKEQISVKDDFFEMGGHSLNITRLAGLIYKKFNVKITTGELFSVRVLEDQARLINDSGTSIFRPVPVAEWQASYPLSSSQKRIWLASQLTESNISYNITGAYVFKGHLDLEALTGALNALIERHESLRTVFREDDNGEIRQYIMPADKTVLKISYHHPGAADGKEDVIRRQIQSSFEAPFNLGEGPLIRADLYQSGTDHWIFAYAMHHAISDGRSMHILIHQLLLFYHSFLKNEPNPLTPLRIQYKDYAVWQQTELNRNIMAVHKDYWLQQFKGELPVFAHPRGKGRPSLKTYKGRILRKHIDLRMLKEIKDYSNRNGGTLFMGLLALVNTVLYRYNGQEDIIIGTPVAGRDHADLEDQIGVYLNTLALRFRFDNQYTFDELFALIKQITMQAHEHRQFPFEELVAALDLPGHSGRNLLFDIWVVLHNTEIKRGSLPPAEGLEISGYEEEFTLNSKFDLLFSFNESDDGIQVGLEYNVDILERIVADNLLKQLDNVMRYVLKDPSMPLLKVNEVLDRQEEEHRKVHLQEMRKGNLLNLINKGKSDA